MRAGSIELLQRITVKTILVTGATDGIGRETARQLLALGHCVMVHGRKRDEAERIAQQLAPAPSGGVALAVWGDLLRMRDIPGRYFVNCRETQSSAAARVPELIRNIL